MKRIIAVVLLLSFVAGTARAWETDLNPDKAPSLGLDVIKGQLAGILRAGVNDTQTDGGIAGFKADLRIPVTEYLTFHTSAEMDGMDNNLQYTEGYRLEIGARVYFLDWK